MNRTTVGSDGLKEAATLIVPRATSKVAVKLHLCGNVCDLLNIFLLKMKYRHTTDETESADESQHWILDSLKFSSFSATNSLVVTMNGTLTDIFP